MGVPLRPRGGERLSQLVLASMVEAMDWLLRVPELWRGARHLFFWPLH
jgi:hypothetical protein